MANLRTIRMRIKSIENTRQITKSMKMVATSKLRKTQTAFSGQRDFAGKCEEILARVSASDLGAEYPLLQPHQERKTSCYVMILGNRGLCGTYNHALLRYCQDLIGASETAPYVIVCGSWGKDQIASAGLKPAETVELSDTPERKEALLLAEKLKKLYLDGTVDEIVFVYQKFRTILSQQPGTFRLLPVQSEGDGKEGKPDTQETVIYEPNRETLLNALLNLYISNAVHGILLEARTGEHAARMTAMSAAADNTEELIEQLTLELNHARQAAITTEISEIAGGAEALRKA